MTGGTVTLLDIRPWYLSSTLVAPNPSPRFVVWAGFLAGWLAAAATLPFWSRPAAEDQSVAENPQAAARRNLPVGLLLKGWAAFCWLSMGSYLLIGGSERLSDTGQLVAMQTSWLLIVPIGLAVCCIGYRVGAQAIGEFGVWLTDHRRPTWRHVAIVWFCLASWWFVQHLVAQYLVASWMI